MAKKKHILLKGEGTNQHTLYGDFTIKDDVITVKNDSLLKHEQPDGSFGEHKTLNVDAGKWVQGRQVEYNPFKNEITRIWD